jgi:hypothetical protein
VEISSGRDAGVPQLIADGSGLILATVFTLHLFPGIPSGTIEHQT